MVWQIVYDMAVCGCWNCNHFSDSLLDLILNDYILLLKKCRLLLETMLQTS